MSSSNRFRERRCGAAHYVNIEITLKWFHKELLVGYFGNQLEYGFKVEWWLAELQ